MRTKGKGSAVGVELSTPACKACSGLSLLRCSRPRYAACCFCSSCAPAPSSFSPSAQLAEQSTRRQQDHAAWPARMLQLTRHAGQQSSKAGYQLSLQLLICYDAKARHELTSM